MSTIWIYYAASSVISKNTMYIVRNKPVVKVKLNYFVHYNVDARRVSIIGWPYVCTIICQFTGMTTWHDFHLLLRCAECAGGNATYHRHRFIHSSLKR